MSAVLLRSPLTSALVALCVAGAGCGAEDPPAGATTATTGASAPTERELVVPWRLAAVRERGRVLVLRYAAGGCLRGDGRAVVAATARSIEIEVREHAIVPARAAPGRIATACTGERRIETLRVRLSEPVAGREIVGGPRLPRPSTGDAAVPLDP
jgi:hypothetical protein